MNWILVIVAIYVLINIAVMLIYSWDKHKAVEGQWRIRERTLIICGFIGPWGAVAGMKLFHHKTQKPKFKINYMFLILHMAIIAAIVAGSFKN